FACAAACSRAPGAPPAAAGSPNAHATQNAPLDVGPRPPVARRDPKTTRLDGTTLVDDYHWLRNKGTPDVVAYLEAENAYTEPMPKPDEALRKKLYGEMLARIKEDDTTPPVKDGAWLYYHRYEKGKQYAIHCRKRVRDSDGAETVILDLNEIAK